MSGTSPRRSGSSPGATCGRGRSSRTCFGIGRCRATACGTWSGVTATANFVFCATDLIFGVDWEFSRERVGDWEAGHSANLSGWPVARAIASSACFPPLFGPVSLGLNATDLTGGAYRGTDRDDLVRKIGLSDGGVYDNMALEPVWKTHDCVLVSDCGGPFGFAAGGNYLSRLARYAAVGLNQAAAMRKRAFFEAIDQSDPTRPNRYRGGYWGLAGSVDSYLAGSDVSIGTAAYSPALVNDVLRRVRTDLDRFTQAETCVLENHGYLLASAVIARRRPELVPPGAPPVRVPHPQWMDEAKVRYALRGSHSRFFLPRLRQP